MKQFKGVLLILVSLSLFLLAGLTLVAMLRSLTVGDTLSAIESAFGSLVIALALLAIAVRMFRAGRARWRPPAE